jgi:hypothetical protein
MNSPTWTSLINRPLNREGLRGIDDHQSKAPVSRSFAHGIMRVLERGGPWGSHTRRASPSA